MCIFGRLESAGALKVDIVTIGSRAKGLHHVIMNCTSSFSEFEYFEFQVKLEFMLVDLILFCIHFRSFKKEEVHKRLRLKVRNTGKTYPGVGMVGIVDIQIISTPTPLGQTWIGT